LSDARLATYTSESGKGIQHYSPNEQQESRFSKMKQGINYPEEKRSYLKH